MIAHLESAWIFHTPLIMQIPAHTVKLTFTQLKNQLLGSNKTIYNLEIFLYITRCAMTSPTPLSKIDLYSFMESPVAATLSPAN